MESNNNDNYVLVLEDRTEVKSEQEAGKLSVVTGLDKQGKLKTTEPIDANQAAFLKFNNKDGLLKNFMTNFLRQFNNPTHFGLYKVAAQGVEKSVETLKTMLPERENPKVKAELEKSAVRFEDFLPKQQKTTAIPEDKVDWKQLETIGVTKERLEESGQLEKLLNWQKSDLVTIAVKAGNETIYTDARLALRTNENGEIGLAIHNIRKEPKLDYPYLGYKFSEEEKATLQTTGNLGKVVELTPKSGDPFSAYVSIDPLTNELVALRADRVSIPKEIKGVKLTDQQYKELAEGKAVKVEGMISKSNKPFDATLQVNAEKKGIEFIFDNTKSYKQRLEQSQEQQQPRIPKKLCGLELSDKQHQALTNGATLYLKNMVDKQGQSFNAYVKLMPEENRLRFFRFNPDKKQSADKVEAVAEEHKTQVAVNNEGKANEATKKLEEPLKPKQTQPTEKQAEQQAEKKKVSRGRKL
ncbi:DUF3945 domain-containing protein [Porphyromonas somerae]|uniref:DUF3945 domain-containing protein n=1 Tax=Porphyromonas somerae TaxID=322095 RepID=UPI002A7FB072|nr:DUF3945 domain-containing protein [Porphyromonas somerae]MDY3885099.1 DUF3945 domain-containing protein [Porphyromonas somerae]